MLVSSPASATRRPLLELDPELGSRLDAERFQQARGGLAVRLVELGDPGRALSHADPAAGGLLIVDGVLTRVLVSGGDPIAAELLGPGDLLRPRAEPGADLLELDVRWEPLGRVIVADLDQRAMLQMTRWPELGTALLERASERAHRLAVT